MRKKILALALSFWLLLMSGPTGVYAAEGKTLPEALQEIVAYYQDNRSTLDHWEQVVGLQLAGANLSSWQMPDWNVADLQYEQSSLKYATTILGMLAAGDDPRNIAGRDLCAELAQRQSGEGSFGNIIDTIWSVVALDQAKAWNNADAGAAISYLIEQKTGDNGFALSGDTADPDTTGFALLALSAHTDIPGVNEVIEQSKECLRNMQLDSGGFGLPAENPNSTASVIRGLLACGEDITADAWTKNGRTMIDALFSFQLEDKSFANQIGGSYNDLATRQALIAVAAMVKAGINYTIVQDSQGGQDNPDNVTVRVRVEGAYQTLCNREVTLSGSALEALKAAVGEENVQLGEWSMITGILGESGQNDIKPGVSTSWKYYVIRKGSIEPSAFNEAPGSYKIQEGDELVFYIGAYDSNTWEDITCFPLVNISPDEPTAGQVVTLKISALKYNWATGLRELSPEEAAALGDYQVKVGETVYTTNGELTIPELAAGSISVTVTNANEAGYPDVVTYWKSISVKNSSGESPTEDTITVYIAVVGKNNRLLYGPGAVTIAKDATAMDALQATGLSTIINSSDKLLIGIEDEMNSGSNGWMYKINGEKPWDVPAHIKVNNGDRIIFWYSTDPDSDGPNWNGLDKLSPGNTQSTISEELKEEITSYLDRYKDELKQLWEINVKDGDAHNSRILNLESRMTAAKAAQLQAKLQNNKVELSNQEIGPNGGVIADLNQEVALLVPQNALKDNLLLSIKELEQKSPFETSSIKVGSSIYEFGPAGTQFAEPVTIRIEVAITEDMDVNCLTPAWYDDARGQWVPIPGLIDVKEGYVIFQIDHFTKFALIEIIPPAEAAEAEAVRVTFSDVNADLAWAQDAIEILAGKGIIKGTAANIFEPQRNISRAEFIQLLTKAAALEGEVYKDGLFHDVKPDDWYAAAIATAVNNKLLAGYPDGTFRPNSNITRNEAACVFSRLLGGATQVEGFELSFRDQEEIPYWANKSIKYVCQQKLMSGYNDHTFRGNNPLTRAEAAVIVYNYLQLIGNSEDV